MAVVNFELNAEVRKDTGKGASRRLRRTNKVPAVVYGAGKQAVSLTLDHFKVERALAHEAFYTRILTLNIDSNPEKVILKDVHRHPAQPRIQHLDFLRIREDEKIHLHIPLHFVGEAVAPGLKDGNGILSYLMMDVEVSCFPANLPEFIEVDISGLELDQILHLSDLKLSKGVEITAFSHGEDNNDLPVVSIHRPRAVVEEEVVAAAPPPSEVPSVKGAQGATATTPGKEKDKK